MARSVGGIFLHPFPNPSKMLVRAVGQLAPLWGQQGEPVAAVVAIARAACRAAIAVGALACPRRAAQTLVAGANAAVAGEAVFRAFNFEKTVAHFSFTTPDWVAVE